MESVTNCKVVAQKLISLTEGKPSKTKIFKLTYYCYAWYLVASDKQSKLFPEAIEAWRLGPSVDDLLNDWQSVEDISNADFSSLDEDTVLLIEDVFNTYNTLSREDIVELTHSEKPWLEARKNKRPNESSKSVLNDDVIFDYYSKLLYS